MNNIISLFNSTEEERKLQYAKRRAKRLAVARAEAKEEAEITAQWWAEHNAIVNADAFSDELNRYEGEEFLRKVNAFRETKGHTPIPFETLYHPDGTQKYFPDDQERFEGMVWTASHREVIEFKKQSKQWVGYKGQIFDWIFKNNRKTGVYLSPLTSENASKRWRDECMCELTKQELITHSNGKLDILLGATNNPPRE